MTYVSAQLRTDIKQTPVESVYAPTIFYYEAYVSCADTKEKKMSDYFTYNDDEYVRQLDPFTDYINLQTFYLSRMSGKDEQTCKDYVVTQLKPGGKFEFKDAKVGYLHRENGRDRERGATTMLEYIASTRNRNYIMVPSWSVTVPSYVQESLYTSYIDKTSAVRARYKKAMFIAEQKNNITDIKFNDGMQSSSKISINSISGAAMSPGTINHTQSLHPALTSVCAISTSTANLNNEKLLAGNRIYTTYQTTLDNVISITMTADYASLQIAMDEFALHYPTVAETMECINMSADLYWRNDKHTQSLHNFVEKLTPIERAAFVYTGDLYHLWKYNPEVVARFFDGFTTRVNTQLDLETAIRVEKESDEDVGVVAKLLCKEYMMGTTMFDLRDEHPDRYGVVCANMVTINEHLDRYQNLIKGILRSPFLNPGANRYMIPNMLRSVVLTSDTDSTIYTSQYWIERLTGAIGFDDVHYNIGAAISFLVNKTVYHQLAMLSKNMGVEDKNLHMISMKNEYYFPVYALTNQTKNYFAYISVREGNVYSKMKLEKKGVGLRSSKIPKNVMNEFDAYICGMMDKIITQQKITLDELFDRPYRTEIMVRESILQGQSDYFQTAQLKSADSYAAGYDAPAQQAHRLWEHVFAPKYGEAPELPYVALKVSTTLTSGRKLEEWVNSIEDRELAKRLDLYLRNEGKKALGSIFVPKITIGFGVIPEEIVRVIDVDKQLMNVMTSFYQTLESFGFYLKNPKNTTMIHRYYKPPQKLTEVN